jgi:hypothetical protein
MTALPETLEHALRLQGYTIDQQVVETFEITTDLGTIVIPEMVTSKLTWQRGTPPEGVDPILGDDLYLSNVPMFDVAYRPVLLSSILDRYRTRRLGYNTPGEWRLAFRRWCNLNMPLFNQRYASTAVVMPLDDIAATNHTLDVGSDFPQALISADTDYATAANDHKAADNGRRRSIASLLEEQRTAYLNVDAEVVEAMEGLFLGIFDRGEQGALDYAPPNGQLPGIWNQNLGYEYW